MRWWEWFVGMAIIGCFFLAVLATTLALIGEWPLWLLAASVPCVGIFGVMWVGGVLGDEA